MPSVHNHGYTTVQPCIPVVVGWIKPCFICQDKIYYRIVLLLLGKGFELCQGPKAAALRSFFLSSSRPSVTCNKDLIHYCISYPREKRKKAPFCKAVPRFELGDKGFAVLCLTTWLHRRVIKRWCLLYTVQHFMLFINTACVACDLFLSEGVPRVRSWRGIPVGLYA